MGGLSPKQKHDSKLVDTDWPCLRTLLRPRHLYQIAKKTRVSADVPQGAEFCTCLVWTELLTNPYTDCESALQLDLAVGATGSYATWKHAVDLNSALASTSTLLTASRSGATPNSGKHLTAALTNRILVEHYEAL